LIGASQVGRPIERTAGPWRTVECGPWTLSVRLLVSLVIGGLSGVLAVSPRFLLTGPGGDFAGWAVRAARDLVTGKDPYGYRVSPLAVPYPLPAAFVGFPCAALPDRWAGGVFAGASAALLAFGVTRERQWWRLLLFASYPYVESLRCVQWPPLLLTAALYPTLLPLTLIKPHLGLPLLLRARITPRSVVLTILVLVASLAIYPTWPFVWLRQIAPYRGVAPVQLLPLGPLLVLALLRWRDRDSYYLFLMAVLPKRAFYDHLLLWLLPRTAWGMAALTSLSWAALYLAARTGDFDSFLILCLYLPTLAALLSRGSPRASKASKATLDRAAGEES
jgi:hypothetical protein